MKLIQRFVVGGTFALATLPTLAMAQGSAEPLPPPRSYNTPPPPPAPPLSTETAARGMPAIAVTKEAGIGGTQAYGRAGVLELGGSAGLSLSGAFTQLSINPSVGWFFMNNFEISGILGLTYVHTDLSNNTVMSILAEPSYHLPFTDYLYGFLGVGAGISYANSGSGAGFALAPRLGMNVIVGRSGILTPAFVMNYSTSETVSANAQTASHTSYGINIGYTVMW